VRLLADGDLLAHPHRRAGPRDLCALSAHLDRLRLEDMPVRDQHAALGEQRHEMGRDEVPRAVEARLASLGVELREPVADGDVRADGEHDLGEARVGSMRDLVQDAPGGHHSHDRGLAAPRRHLACVAAERPRAISGLVQRDSDALQKVRARLREKDDRLDGLDLREEEAMPAALAPPVIEQLQRRARDAGIALRPPLPDPRAQVVDER